MSPSVSRAAAISLTGIEGAAVHVEAAVTQQLPGMSIIGLPDTTLAESKLRVRTAAAQAGLPLANRFVVVNLAPAALPKQGSGFDLAIALAAIAASHGLPHSTLASTAHIGELSLDGAIRRPVGLLSAVLAARRLGYGRVMVPSEGAAEARLVPEMDVVDVPTLAAAVAWHRRELPISRYSVSSSPPTRDSPPQASTLPAHPDMADIIGQPEAVEAMVIAAAGRHHVSLLGPPGAGKTLLASRLPSLLPDLTGSEQLLASSIASLGDVGLDRLITRPPFESPHHTASQAAMLGSGDGRGVRPGAISRACHGILFLDEAPEFGRATLDGLRQPLESGRIDITRARLRTSLPARVQLVLASNPCPCGKSGETDTAAHCICTPHVRVRYLARISGPLTDRVDLRLSVRRVTSVLAFASDAELPPTSAELRAKVIAARETAAARLANTPWSVNGELPGEFLRSSRLRLSPNDTAVLDRALARGALTLRGYDRTLRIAWSIADLAGKSRPTRDDLAQALMLRGGEQ